MQGDQVKYTDLFSTDIVSGLDSLKRALEEVVKQIAALKQEATALKAAISSSSTATRQQQQDMSQYAAAVERNRAELKRLTAEEARLKAAIAEANRMTKLQAQAEQAAAGSLNEMRAKYKLLVAEMGRYNLKTEEGRRKMQTTAAQARKLRDEIYKLEASYGQFGRNVGNYTGSLSRFSARLKEAAARFVAFNAAFLSFTGMIRFGKELFNVRKELESTLVIYKALVGDVQGAKIFEEVKNFALTTPVTLNAASKAVQTMLGFGVAADKAVDIMKRLGDISGADAERMERLALAYAQATQAGRLMGQDTLQFINAGFNPLYYISLRTGESMESLRDQMKKGKIDISQVTQAIIDATSEGGQFNGMLEKQKETMKGAAAIMEGAWQNMLNEMGSDMEVGIVGIIKWLTKLMQNWRETVNTLAQLAISFGTAKASLIAYRVVVETLTKAEVAEAIATTNATGAKKAWIVVTNMATTAAKKLVTVLAKFAPFAVIAGLTMVAAKITEVATASQRAAKELKEFEKAAAENVTNTISQYQQLGREWKQLGSNQQERATWIKEHKRLFDELGISIKDAAEADRAFSEEGTEAYINAVKRRAVADAYKERLAQASVRKQDARDLLSSMGADGKLIDKNGNPVSVGTLNALSGDPAFIRSIGGFRNYDKIKNAYLDYYNAVKEVATIEKKIEEFEKGALANSAGIRPNNIPQTTGGDDGNGKIKFTANGYNNSYKGVTSADVLVAEAKAMKDKGDDALAEIQLWYDKKVAIANASYTKEMEDLERGRNEKNKSLEKELKDAKLYLGEYDEELGKWVGGKYQKSLKKLEQDFSKGLISKQEFDTQKEILDAGFTDAEKLMKNAAVERQRIKDYYDKMETVAEQKKQNELSDIDAENEKKRTQLKLKTMADNWQAERAQFVAEGADRRALIDAEFTAEIARLKVMLQLNRDVNGEKMSDEQRQKIEEWINLLEKLQKAGDFGGINPNQVFGNGGANLGNRKAHTWTNIMDVLTVDEYGNNRSWTKGLFGNMDTEEINRWKSGVQEAFNQAKAALQTWMDARKEAADQAKEQADDAVSAAENALNREIELRNQGYANNVAMRERELADAKKAQQQAIEAQKKAEKEQLAIDTAMQASSIVTAIANIIKEWSKMGIAGQVASVGAILTMLGTFAWARTQAFAAVNSKQYREGGVMLLEGGSHQSGHDVNLGIGPDGSNLRAEGGEYFAVINKRNSRRYGSEIPNIVNALNSGMFEDRYIKTSDAMGMLPRIIKADDGSTVDLSAVESGVGALVKQGERTWSTEGEYRVMRYKNLTRRVRVG